MELDQLFLMCGPNERALHKSFSFSSLGPSAISDDEVEEAEVLPGITQVFSKFEIVNAVGLIVDHFRAIQKVLRAAHSFQILRRVKLMVAFLKQQGNAAVAERRRCVAALMEHFDDHVREVQRRPRGCRDNTGGLRGPVLASATSSPDGKSEKLSAHRSFQGSCSLQISVSSPRSPARDTLSSPSSTPPASPQCVQHIPADVPPSLLWQWTDLPSRVSLWDHISTLSLPSVRQRACQALYYAFRRQFHRVREEWNRQHLLWVAQQREEVPCFEHLYTRAFCHASLGRPYFTNCVGRRGQEDAPHRKALYDAYLHHARTKPKFQLDPRAVFCIPADTLNDMLLLLGEAQQPINVLTDVCEGGLGFSQAVANRLSPPRAKLRLELVRGRPDPLACLLRQECQRELVEVEGAVHAWRTQLQAQIARDEVEAARREQQLSNDAVSPRLFNAALGSRRSPLSSPSGDFSPRLSPPRTTSSVFSPMSPTGTFSGSLHLPRLAPGGRRAASRGATLQFSSALTSPVSSDHNLLNSPPVRSHPSFDLLNTQQANADSPWKIRQLSSNSALFHSSFDLDKGSQSPRNKAKPLLAVEPLLVFHVTSPELEPSVLLTPRSVRRRTAHRKQASSEPPSTGEWQHHHTPEGLLRNSSPQRGSFGPVLLPITPRMHPLPPARSPRTPTPDGSSFRR